MLWKSNITNVPAFIFQLIDHIYISDHRGIYFSSSFSLLINTTFLKEVTGNARKTCVTNHRFSLYHPQIDLYSHS